MKFSNNSVRRRGRIPYVFRQEYSMSEGRLRTYVRTPFELAKKSRCIKLSALFFYGHLCHVTEKKHVIYFG